jgi:hypothetical protein
MNEPDPHNGRELVEPAPASRALPPPPQNETAQVQGLFERVIGWIELHPLASAAFIFIALALVHLLVLDLAGVAFSLGGSTPVEVLLLAFIAYNIVLPTLLARSCLNAFVDLAPALVCNDRDYDQCLDTLASPHAIVRLTFCGFWAVVLTPVFGNLFQSAIPGDAPGVMWLTVWLYIRIALTFGLLGSTITYIAMLHYRFATATGDYLRVDLFDMGQLQPLALHAKRVALYLLILLALTGPVIAEPESVFPSAWLLGLGIALTLIAVLGSMWGARRAIRGAKHTALAELQAYAREIWRRAYANGRIVEAVALPAMAAMLTVRGEIARVWDWPGGKAVPIRFALLSLIPVTAWFGSQIVAFATAFLLP